jgi:hypothetical protein
MQDIAQAMFRLQLQNNGRSAYLILPAKSEKVVTLVR